MLFWGFFFGGGGMVGLCARKVVKHFSRSTGSPVSCFAVIPASDSATLLTLCVCCLYVFVGWNCSHGVLAALCHVLRSFQPPLLNKCRVCRMKLFTRSTGSPVSCSAVIPASASAMLFILSSCGAPIPRISSFSQVPMRLIIKAVLAIRKSLNKVKNFRRAFVNTRKILIFKMASFCTILYNPPFRF